MADVIQKAVNANAIKNGTAVVYDGGNVRFDTLDSRVQNPNTGHLNFLDERFDDPQYYGN